MSDSASRNAVAERRGGGFLARLARDIRGNTLVIVGAALFPLAAMIGSGVDMSRAYMAKHRLQTACDAAALAGRRVMQNDTMTTAVEAEAVRYFRFNFPQTAIPVQGSTPAHTEGPYATDGVTPTVTRPSSGTVRVSATTRIPTTVMKMFGFSYLPLTVTCDAALNFVNTDIMLVLDTTGSMNNDINDNFTFSDSQRKITALRSAVMALYNELQPTQTQLEANGLRLRYGVVPYSTSVNVGNLITAVNPAYMRNDSPYQSREAYYNTQVPIANTPTSVTTWEYYNNSSGAGSSSPTTYVRDSGQCATWAGAAPSNGGGPAPTATTVTSYSYTQSTGWGWPGAPDTSGTNQSCRRSKTVATTTYTVRYSFTSWRYIQSSFDTTQLRGGSTTIASDTGGTVATAGNYYNERAMATQVTGVGTTTVNWDGCIEERDSLPTIAPSADLSIPSGALDLNINLIPTTEAERWRPHWPRVLWKRNVSASSTNIVGETTYMGNSTGNDVACPAEARRLQAWSNGNMQSYLNTLTPNGYTYHDIGMLWGARMLSNAGIFAADNPDTFASMPVTRHIIFMTDGQLMPYCDAYTAWGIERNDRRVTGSYSCTDQYDRHMQRFKMVCNAARGMGYSIWVIAFGTTLSPEMASCASNSNQASTATNSPELIARFQQIGANIGALRLTQ